MVCINLYKHRMVSYRVIWLKNTVFAEVGSPALSGSMPEDLTLLFMGATWKHLTKYWDRLPEIWNKKLGETLGKQESLTGSQAG